jgi:hypothetical protein
MATTPAGSSAFAFGASYFDRKTEVRFEIHHPQERPDLWKQYLDGGEARYKKHGYAPVLGRDEIQQGQGVSMFFVGFDAHEKVVAGVRVHGPLSATSQVQALAEMAGSSEIDELASIIERSLPFGVIELKGAWGTMASGGMHAMGNALGRCPSHALTWLRAELAIGTVAMRLQGKAEQSGARQIGTESVPYPSERFRTIMAGWRRSQIMEQADPKQREYLRVEADQLFGDTVVPAPPTAELARRKIGGWRPIVLDTRDRVDRQVIEQTKRDPALQVIDDVANQRAELQALLPPCPQEMVEEHPRQVFYPWKKTLVTILGPKGFDRLRLDRNRNRITQGEQEQLRKRAIGVVGLSVGHSIAHVLAMEGICGELRLADFDAIEVSNLNRIPASLVDVGENKAVVAARRIAEIDPYLNVKVFPEGITPENVEQFVDGLDVLIDECDSLPIKVLLREVARHRGIPVLMETSDRGLIDVERFDLEPSRPLFHGLLGDTTAQQVAQVAPEEHVGLVLRIVDASEASARGAASMAEIGVTLSTWPQLGGDVTLGAATMAAAIRRLGRGEELASGRVRVDVDSSLNGLRDPSPALELASGAPDGTEYRTMPADPTRAIAHAASLAPSGGNCQPWHFEFDAGEFRIFLDPSKSMTMDVSYRGSYVAIGAALFNARVAAAARGVLGDYTLFPHGEETFQPVAALKLGGRTDPELSSWYPRVIDRTTNRKRGEATVLGIDREETLRVAAEKEGALLHVLSDRTSLEACARILAESERLRFLSPTLHAEMLSELSWPGRDSLDTGIDVRTLELSPTEMGVLGIVQRGDVMSYLADWGAGQALGMNAFSSVQASSAVAVVGLRGSTARSFVEGGMAVERVWLTAEKEGLGVSPLSPLFLYAKEPSSYDELVGPRHAAHLHDLQGRFHQLIGAEADESLLLVLRLSEVPPPSFRSRRLPLEEMTRGLPSPDEGYARRDRG